VIKNLDETMMQSLSFPDIDVAKMEFFPETKILNVFVDGGYLSLGNGVDLGAGVLYFNDWDSISIRRYIYSSKLWLSVTDTDPEQLKDLCEVKFTNSEVFLCGFGKKEGDWLEWRIINTKMHAEFEEQYKTDNYDDPNRCRICGLYQEKPAWEMSGTSPTHEICPCCGVKSGDEDCSVESCRLYREKWLSKGVRWKAPRCKPVRWNLNEQLKHIPYKYL